MEESGFPQWSGLYDELKLKIISKMDYKTRRYLRNCSKKEKQLVEMFPYRKEMHLQCALCPSTSKWFCKYSPRSFDFQNAPYEEFFDTCEEAYDRMKQLIKTAEIIFRLVINLKLNSKITLRDVRKRINVEQLCVCFIGGKSNEEKLEWYNFLFSQLNLHCLKRVSILADGETCCTPEQNDDLFKLERTVLNLNCFDFSGLLSEEQFAGLRTSNFFLSYGECITPSGIVKFIQKQILRPTPSLSYIIENISSELHSYFFGESHQDYYPDDIELVFNVVGSDLKLSMKIEWVSIVEEDDNNDEMMEDNPNLYSATLEIEVLELGNFLERDPYEINTVALDDFPHLRNCISAISQALPIGFTLMQGLRNY